MDGKPNVIELPDDEVVLVREAVAAVMQEEQRLGRMRAQFLIQETEQMNRWLEKSREYQDLQAMLLKKNRKEPGQYQLVPEIGAFVAVPSIGTDVQQKETGDRP